MIKKIVKAAVLLAAVAVLSAVAAVVLFRYFNTPQESSVTGKAVVFSVVPGDTVGSIADRLFEKGLIKSSAALRLYSRIMGSSGSFKIGSYRIRYGEKMNEIHDILIEGHQILYKVTIPEGWTFKRIGELLEEEGITNTSDFYKAVSDRELLSGLGIEADNAEGFLFPDTYLFQKDFPAERTVSFMIKNFFKNLDMIYPGYSALSFNELYQKIILASIVEREYRIAEEAPLIAGVFYNRLKNSMSLGSCATIAYIITDVEDKAHPSRITYDDLEIKSPYNTYINKGLPPAPIANPGKTALEAAFHPADTKYMFFVLEDPVTGRHKFTETYRDHLTAKNLYIKTK